jgi:uncharacterized protein (TIGR02452 family)
MKDGGAMHPLTRSQAAQLGREAVAIAAEGRYRRVDGAVVDIGDAVRRCVEGTRIIRPDDSPAILRRGREAAPRDAAARAEVTQETTLAAARRLVEQENAARLLVLNFASAKSPGGGFLGGSRAQEESLARSSALYASLQRAGAYYDQNRACGSSLYTDHAVLSPDVPVFRADDGAPLDRPYAASFLTMPAVNVGALGRSGEHARVEPVMAGRVEKVLALAAAEGFETLVLGAWGCGAFRNDPRLIARLFHDALYGGDRWAWKFARITLAVFAVATERENLRAFEDLFVPNRVTRRQRR